MNLLLESPRHHFTIKTVIAVSARRLSAILLVGLLAVLIAPGSLADHKSNHVDVAVEGLSEKAQTGQLVFNQNCASCHGVNGEGSEAGPPLIHSIYNPGHHSNKSFYRAVTQGVRQHHWSFGDMPPQRQIGFSEMTYILTFVREVQAINGIETEEHRM